ncbi:RagB/SusD family nutrient uptake outer membrane protein [Bacteroides thetaiotaomicron]|nr:RagB/SusD family nutrient uptake outer membrane protein [Bacteroides thetaiotaomicron]
MKIYSYLLLGAMFLLGGCSDLLDIDPKNKIPADELFSTPEGVQAHMANLYGRLPIEDFTYSPNRGFNVGVGTDVNNAGFMAAHFCDEAIHPEYNDFGEEWFDYWEDGYKLIRDLNSLLVTIPTLTSITEQQKNEINAETHFLRAYTYFALAKRYGGSISLKNRRSITVISKNCVSPEIRRKILGTLSWKNVTRQYRFLEMRMKMMC